MRYLHDPRLQVVRDLGLFAATVLLAVVQGWRTTDLLWSLWVTSVVLGYAFLLTAVAIRPVAALLR